MGASGNGSRFLTRNAGDGGSGGCAFVLVLNTVL
jgi:hypothetical protein